MSDISSVSMGPHDGQAKSEFDHERAERAITELLLALGEDISREGLRDTLARVARALKENFEGLGSGSSHCGGQWLCTHSS